MDYLDSFDLDTAHKKCHRVRSWYLYEQYKSLEKNQSDAAQRLKDKSYQDKILRQEMKERRARRKLCDTFGSCQSESKIDKTRSAQPRAPLSVNTDDLYESFCVLHNDHLYDFEDNISQGSSQTSKIYEEFRTPDDKKEDSDNESAHSVIKNVTFENNLADDVKGELEIVKKNIAENINLQLETVKENIECLEKFTKLGDADDLPENDSSDLFEQCESSQVCTVIADKKFCPKNDKEFFPLWAKMVAFAYESVHLYHGNFYNSSSYQLMLAVLLCDALRLGINRMCHILQPYVSPIKYATSDSDLSVESYKNAKRKSSECPEKCLSIHYKKAPKCDSSKNRFCKKIKSCRRLRWLLDRDYQSENKWQQHSKYSFDNRFNEMKYASEPWHSVSKLIDTQKSSGKSSCNIWPDEFSRAKFSEQNVCKCRCLRNVATPILQLARYIESVLQDIGDQ
ncbi:uncharacterized protein LOC123871973 isoform X1 [Maniola jurtina]|uniref:uncharacterized protein LOC123871973 isoform X1 n=1 Tax=Maniola jurtina TaxID=191418 RepID=UPI001E685F58|nr:uncharacterized protein LOC123871973 isoform X1 [Maniola jurtina]